MIHYKTPEEIELMRHSATLVGDTIAEVARAIRPGVTTRMNSSRIMVAVPHSKTTMVIPMLRAFRSMTPWCTVFQMGESWPKVI